MLFLEGSSGGVGEGPPIEGAGSYFFTNLFPENIEPIKPSVGSAKFGFKVSGPEGKLGLIGMFISSGLIDHLGTLAGEDLEPEDFAVFNREKGRENQVSNALTLVNNGLLLDLGVKFTDNSTVVDDTDFDPNKPGSGKGKNEVTKLITVAPELNISSAPSTFVVTGNTVKIYGFLKDPEVVNRVKVQRLVNGKYVTVSKPKVKEDGSYSSSLAASKLGLGSSSSSSILGSRTSTVRTRATSNLVSSKYKVRR